MCKTFNIAAVMVAAIASLTAQHASANLIIEDLHISNPDGTLVSGETWDKVSFALDGIEVPLLGVQGDHGRNYVYLDVDIAHPTNTAKPYVTVRYGEVVTTVMGSWSIDKHVAGNPIVLPRSLSEYSIAGDSAGLLQYFDADHVNVCPAMPVMANPVNVTQDTQSLYIPNALYKHTETGNAIVTLMHGYAESAIGGTLYGIPYTAKTSNGTSHFLPINPESSIRSLQQYRDSILPIIGTRNYFTSPGSSMSVWTMTSGVDLDLTFPTTPQSPIACHQLKTPEIVKPGASYGDIPVAPGQSIPIVF